MENSLFEKVKAFKGLNDIALKGEIVILGSSYMADFPFYELANKNSLDTAIYNRSIKNLTIADAAKVLKPCVFDLAPSKVFLHLGEDEDLQENSFETYKNLIIQIKSALPNAHIYIIELRTETEAASRLNCQLSSLCDGQNTVFVRLSRKKSASFMEQFRELCHYFRSRSISFCEAFAIV